MVPIQPTTAREQKLASGAMHTADIVFFVIAGVSPMGAVVALLALSIALGNGAGVPAPMSSPGWCWRCSVWATCG